MNTSSIQQTHGEAVKAGMKAKAMAGVPAGPVPLGYRKVCRDGIVTVEIDRETAPLVREAFRLAALRRQSLRKILIALNAEGLVSRHGKPLSATALWRILKNPFYAGMIAYDGEEVFGGHKPLVSRSEFERAMRSISSR